MKLKLFFVVCIGLVYSLELTSRYGNNRHSQRSAPFKHSNYGRNYRNWDRHNFSRTSFGPRRKNRHVHNHHHHYHLHNHTGGGGDGWGAGAWDDGYDFWLYGGDAGWWTWGGYPFTSGYAYPDYITQAVRDSIKKDAGAQPLYTTIHYNNPTFVNSKFLIVDKKNE